MLRRQTLEKRCTSFFRPFPADTSPNTQPFHAMGSVVQPNEWVGFRLPSGTVKIIQAIPNT